MNESEHDYYTMENGNLQRNQKHWKSQSKYEELRIVVGEKQKEKEKRQEKSCMRVQVFKQHTSLIHNGL